MRSVLVLIVPTLCALIAFSASADERIGTLTRSEGTVQIFARQSKTPPEKKEGSARALFEGESYLVRDGKVGDRIENGNIVRTAPDGRARVVFENGDQFQVGPGTAYRVSWSADAKGAPGAKGSAASTPADTRVELLYGKFRGVVVKEGPRRRMFVRSKAAVMGVRGTDFFVDENPATGQTEFSVLRGSVAVSPVLPEEKDEAGRGREVEVKAGMIATVTPVAPTKSAGSVEPSPGPTEATATKEIVYGKGAPPPEGLPKVELSKLSKSDLREIDRSATLSAPKSASAAPSVVALEKNAFEATLEDIRRSAPAHSVNAASGTAKTVDDLQHGAVERLMAEASEKSRRKRQKPATEELEEERQAYRKYFQFPAE